jgi:hypothetical protein
MESGVSLASSLSGPSSPTLIPQLQTNNAPDFSNSSSTSDISLSPLTPPASPPLPCTNSTARPSRLKFVLPSKLPHQSSYANGTYHGLPLRLGMRVRLLRRTDDTVGTVRFIGEVGFADGTWIGVELDRRGELILSFGEQCLRKEMNLTIFNHYSWQKRWFGRRNQIFSNNC